ncbi:Thiosulfate sulfurtransferase rdl2, mitochondrial [Basidiobolus ranarum]|uniref:Thiosulfate sulfurtransferase rdl2, mitochondrial n=1 Tax=Basidiobolus ranarum TaxID=34480 RepID=A0ABR2W3H6_9FUNG
MFSLRVVNKSSYGSIIRTFTKGTFPLQSRFTDLVHSVRDNSQIEEISVPTLRATYNPEKFQLVDVRETFEQEKGIIPEAICLPRGVLEKDIEKKVPDSKEVIVYCASGYRSILAAESLKRMGYQVKSLKGGFNEWKEAEDNANLKH